MKELLAALRAKQDEKKTLVARRKELRTTLEGHRSKGEAEPEGMRSEYYGTDDKMLELDQSIDGIRMQIMDKQMEQRTVPQDGITSENYRSSGKYRAAFFRSWAAGRVSDEDNEIMAMGKRAITDMNGGTVVSGASYLLPQTTIDMIEKSIKEYGKLYDYVGGYSFTGNISIPIGSTETLVDNEDGTHSLRVSFSEVKIEQEAIVVSAEIKNILMQNSIPALEAYIAEEIYAIIAEKLDFAILYGDGGSFEGILPALTAKKYTTKLTFTDIVGIFGSLKGAIVRNSAFVMNESTFWNKIASNVDSTGQPIQIGGQVFWSYDSNGNAKLMGKDVVFTDGMGDGDVLFGAFKRRYKKNTSLEKALEADRSEKFSADKTVIRGKVYSGGKPILPTESFVLYVEGTDKVATPTATPGAGAVASGTAVVLASATTGAAIYYTVDGSTPTKSSSKYSASNKPTLTEAATVKAIAIKAGMADSDVLSAAYTIS